MNANYMFYHLQTHSHTLWGWGKKINCILLAMLGEKYKKINLNVSIANNF